MREIIRLEDGRGYVHSMIMGVEVVYLPGRWVSTFPMLKDFDQG